MAEEGTEGNPSQGTGDERTRRWGAPRGEDSECSFELQESRIWGGRRRHPGEAGEATGPDRHDLGFVWGPWASVPHFSVASGKISIFRSVLL